MLGIGSTCTKLSWYSRCARAGLGVLVKRSELVGLRLVAHQLLKMPDCFRKEEGIRAHATYVRRHILKHEHLIPSFHRVNDESCLIYARTILDTAFHTDFPLSNGFTHFTHTPSAYTKPRLPSSCTRRKIRWDPKKEEIIGDAAATEMLSPKYREPWKLSV